MNPKQLASALGKLGKGRKKTMTQAAMDQRKKAAQCKRKKSALVATNGSR